MTATARKSWYRHLYVQVLIGVALGIACGLIAPQFAVELKPLADGFIKLVKMLIGPIIFCTVAHGIASVGDFKKLGHVGWRTFVYFEVVSTLALLMGLAVANGLRPGDGMNFDPSKALHSDDVKAKIDDAVNNSKSLDTVHFLLDLIPETLLSPFSSGKLLQTLLVAIVIGVAVARMGERGVPIIHGIDYITQVLFGVMNVIVRAAPLGALGGMAYLVGENGARSLANLAVLMLGFYATAIAFIVVVLGSIARMAGFSLFRLIAYLKEELLLVLGTSSSETALPGLMAKLEKLGCPESTVGLVVPTGYSFNLDGTNIYLSMGALFLAQATNTPLDLSDQLKILLIAMLTSKGAAGVTGAGFTTLVATISICPGIPIGSVALLVGIDRFMSECRSLTNLIGNGVATLVVSRWEGSVSAETLRRRLAASGDPDESPDA